MAGEVAALQMVGEPEEGIEEPEQDLLVCPDDQLCPESAQMVGRNSREPGSAVK